MKAARPTLSDRVGSAEHASGLGRAATIIAAATVASAIVAGAYLALTPRRETAVSKLVVERATLATSRSADRAETVDAFLAAQADVMRSSEVLRLADADAALHELPTLAAQRDPVPTIRRGLRVDVAGNGGVLTVSYASTSVEDARRIVDGIVKAYVSYQSDKRRDRVDELTREAEAVRKPIAEEQAKAARALADVEANLAGRGSPEAATQRVRTSVDLLVQTQAAVAETRRVYDEAVVAAGPLLSKLNDEELDRAIRTAGLGVGESAAGIADRLEAALRQMTELRRVYAENHPAVIRLRNQIDRLRVDRVAAARREWQGATERQAETKGVADRAAAEANAIVALVDERDRRRGELARADARLAEADRQLDIARGVASGTTLTVDVLTRAEAGDPRYPPTPRTTPTLALALLAGLGLGTTIATIGEYRRVGTLRHVGARRGNDPSAEARLAREAFGLRVLGNVPELPIGANDQAAKLRGDIAAPLARAADAARTEIVAEGFARGTLAIASQREGEGRTTVAHALGAAMARAGGRVLVIDAGGGIDGGAPGFVDALLDGTLGDRIKSSAVSNLHTLGGGRRHVDFDLFVNSPRLVEVLSACAERFDQVLIDCASLVAGDTARVIAASTDAAVLVSDGAVASLRRAATGRDVLQLVGARVLGVIINRSKYATEPGANGARTTGEA